MSNFNRERHSAEAIARLAGKHILRERDRHLEISLKAVNDLVTNVDRSSEKLIIEQIRRTFPQDQILGEEYGESTNDTTALHARRRWVIDPIDGTLNFARGIPLFCISIALQVDGQSTVAAVYDPTRDELFSAALGDGAHLNGSKLSVSDCATLDMAVLVTGFPVLRSEAFEATLRQFTHLTRTGRGVRRLGSAALDLAYVASGRLDGFWEYGLQPWDTAAGYLLVTEAGGTVTDMNGDNYQAESPGILATNSAIHHELLSELLGAA